MSIDKELVKKMQYKVKRCKKGHLNSPNAKICWVCGGEIEESQSFKRREVKG